MNLTEFENAWKDYEDTELQMEHNFLQFDSQTPKGELTAADTASLMTTVDTNSGK